MNPSVQEVAPPVAETGARWFRVSLATITRRVAEDTARARRWFWVEWRQPGYATKLALMGPLAHRIGLLEFTLKRRRNRGAWVRRLSVACGEKKGSSISETQSKHVAL